MPDAATVLADPAFHQLPLEERQKVLSKIDERFRSLPTAEQVNVLERKRQQLVGSGEPPPVGAAKGERAMVGGTDQPGSAPPGVSALGRFAVEQGPAIAGATAGGALAGTPGAVGGALLGRTASTLATEGRLPTAGEAAGEVATTLLPELFVGGGAKLLFSAKGKVKLGEDLRAATTKSVIGPDMVPVTRAQRVGRGTDFRQYQSSGEVSFVYGHGPEAEKAVGLYKNMRGPDGGEIIKGYVPKDMITHMDGTHEGALVNARAEGLNRRFRLRPEGDNALNQYTVEGWFGQYLKDRHPSIAAGLRRDTQKMYRVERFLGRSVPAAPQPSVAIVQSARDAKTMLEREDLTPEQKTRVVGVLDRIIERGDAGKPMTYADYLKWESDLRDVAPRNFVNRVRPDTQSKGVLANLQYQVGQELDGMARQNPRLLAARKNAQDFFRHEVIPDRDMLDSLGKDSLGPNDVVQAMVQGGRSDQLQRFFKRITPEEQHLYRTAWWSQKLREATDEATGDFDGQALIKHWKDLKRDNPTNAHLLAGGEGKDGKQVSTLLGHLEQTLRTERVRSFAAHGARVGVAGTSIWQGVHEIYNGHLERGLGMIAAGTVGQGYLASVLSKPEVIRWFNRGIEAGPGTRLAARYGSRIVAQSLGHYVESVVGGPDETPSAIPGP